MGARLGETVVVALLCMTALGSLPAAQGPASQGVGRLSGRVIAADDGAPVKGAYVRLSGPALSPGQPQSRVVLTGDDGAFRFASLPAGAFTVQIEPPSGFVAPRTESLVTLSSGDSRELAASSSRLEMPAF